MTDFVERLRACEPELAWEAADEIQRLRREVERLRAVIAGLRAELSLHKG
jgi:hypothetical protein